MTGGMTGVGVALALGVGMISETAEGTAVLTGVAGQLPPGVCDAQLSVAAGPLVRAHSGKQVVGVISIYNCILRFDQSYF